MDHGRIRAIAQWLRIFLAPGQVTECRALHVQGRQAVTSFHNSPESLAARAVELDKLNAVGVYFTPNPLRPDILTATKSCRTSDVIERAWLLIDCDPIRETGLSSTEGERHASWQVLQRVIGSMEAAGAVNPVVADSGNGFHVCYPVRLPADDASKALIKSALKGLSERCSDEFAKVDTSTHDAPRIWKLYGTRSRKGQATDDRPHRYSQLLSGEMPTEEQRETNNKAIRRLLEIWAFQDRWHTGRPAEPLGRESKYATAALLREAQAVATAPPQNWNNQLNESAFNLGTLVGAGLLTREEVIASLTTASRDRGHEGPEVGLTIRSGMEAGILKPRDVSTLHQEQAGSTVQSAQSATTEDEEDATAADLVEINATIRWVWPGWIPLGVLTALASEPGVGKTRMCLDLARRLALGMPWPDGTENTYPAGSKTLWIPADNQHAELGTIPEQFGFDPRLLYLNAPKSNPFIGTMLDTDEERKAFERRIRRINPALIIVDTSLNATDKGCTKPEDAKAFFKPLQEIAARCQTAIVLVTHLNANGAALGRRIEGQCRVVLHLDKPDPDQQDRRRFWVKKSNSLFPQPLGVTMSGQGNEYDNDPPKSVEEGPGRRGPVSAKLQEAVDWIRGILRSGPKKVGFIVSKGEMEGFSIGTLYRAMRAGGIEEFEAEDKKWWQLTNDEE